MGQVFRYSLHFLDLSNQLKQEQSQRENLNICNQVAHTHWAHASENDDDDDIEITGTAVLLVVKMTKF